MSNFYVVTVRHIGSSSSSLLLVSAGTV